MTQYQYDEQGVLFQFFFLTILLCALIPLTINERLARNKKKESNWGNVSDDANISISPKKPTWYNSLTKTQAFILAGWIVVGLIVILLLTSPLSANKNEAIWDPFEILGVTSSTSKDEIRRQFRRLSLIYHPDKAVESDEMSLQFMQDKFVEITKAYKALTDEEVWKNYMEYGHPDGKQEYVKGIALPKWLADAKNSYLVLGIYGIIFGIVLPYSVGSWWNKRVHTTKHNVHVKTASNFFLKYKPTMEFDDALSAFADSVEMKAIFQKKSPKFAKNDIVEFLKLHMQRKVPASNNSHYEELLLESPTVLRSLFLIQGAFEYRAPLLSTIELTRCIIQALPQKANPIWQLPYVFQLRDQIPKYIESAKALLAVPEKERRDMFRDLNEQQYSRMLHIARKFPVLELLNYNFETPGEKLLYPNSIIHLRISIRTFGAGEETPQLSEKKEDLLVDFKKALRDSEQGNQKTAEELGFELTGPAYTPAFPGQLKAKWWIIASSPISGKLLFAPVLISDFGARPKIYNIQLSAPSKPDRYPVRIQLVSDVYFGTDVSVDTEFTISDPSTKVEPEPSTLEQEEDSLSSENNLNDEDSEEDDDDDDDEAINTDTDSESESD